MRCLAVALALTGTHGFMSHKLPATPMRGAATQLTMRLGNGGGGTRRGGFTGRLGAGWKKGIVPRGPGGGGGMMGGGPPRDVSRRAADDEGEEPPAPKAAEAAGLWAAYEKALEKDPLLIKGLTSMTGFAIGDILAQQFIEKKGKYNLNRTIKMASFGLLVHGTTSHWFYGKLDGKIPGTDAGAVASKVFIDQGLVEPDLRRHVLRLHGSLGAPGRRRHDQAHQGRPHDPGHGLVDGLARGARDQLQVHPGGERRVLYINTIQIFYRFLSIIGNRDGKKKGRK